jgi:hypothetical protein
MKKLFALLLIAFVAINFVACSSDDDEGPTGTTTYKISGTVTDADGNGVGNQTVEAKSADETKTTTTDSQGAYEFTGLKAGATYTVSVNGTDYYFTTSDNAEVTLNADANVNFTAVGIYGTWVSEGTNVAPLLVSLFATARIEATFNSNGSYEVVQTDTSGASVTLSGTFTMTKSSVDNIFEITAEQTSPAALTSTGIFEIYSDSSPFTMKYEIVQTSPDIGATPPTPAAGFGSTNGGALGTINVQTYIRQ